MTRVPLSELQGRIYQYIKDSGGCLIEDIVRGLGIDIKDVTTAVRFLHSQAFIRRLHRTMEYYV